jgi:hypothetical protein
MKKGNVSGAFKKGVQTGNKGQGKNKRTLNVRGNKGKKGK